MKTIIFDFDGTIVYTAHLWISTFDQFEKDYELPKTPTEKRLNQLTNSVLSLATEYFNDYEKVRIIFKTPQSLEMYFNNQTEKNIYEIPPIEGIIEFIEELNKRNIPIIIASSGRRNHIEEYLNKWKIKVDDIVTSVDVLKPKPNVDIYIEAMKRSHLDIQPSDCLIFEDNPKPALNASKYGFNVCMIKYKNTTIFKESFDFTSFIIYDYISIFDKIKL